MSNNPQIHNTWLPDGRKQQIDFLESSFFSTPGRCLPTPAEARALSASNQEMAQPDPVKFEHLDLIVKYGPHISTAEAQCLWAIKKVFGNEVPVPEVYGWRVDKGHVFIYMQLIRGETLLERWNSLDAADITSICHQLRQIMTSLRQAKQDPKDSFVGSIDRNQLLDILFEGQPPGGPFTTIKQFNDWFSRLPFLPFPDSENIEDPWRTFLPDTAAIKLTHGDLHRGNIIVSSTRPLRVLAIIDWAHCGWYPDYWEYCKAAYTCAYDGEWRNKWIPMFLVPRIEVFEHFVEYAHAMGGI